MMLLVQAHHSFKAPNLRTMHAFLQGVLPTSSQSHALPNCNASPNYTTRAISVFPYHRHTKAKNSPTISMFHTTEYMSCFSDSSLAKAFDVGHLKCLQVMRIPTRSIANGPCSTQGLKSHQSPEPFSESSQPFSTVHLIASHRSLCVQPSLEICSSKNFSFAYVATSHRVKFGI